MEDKLEKLVQYGANKAGTHDIIAEALIITPVSGHGGQHKNRLAAESRHNAHDAVEQRRT